VHCREPPENTIAKHVERIITMIKLANQVTGKEPKVSLVKSMKLLLIMRPVCQQQLFKKLGHNIADLTFHELIDLFEELGKRDKAIDNEDEDYISVSEDGCFSVKVIEC